MRTQLPALGVALLLGLLLASCGGDGYSGVAVARSPAAAHSPTALAAASGAEPLATAASGGQRTFRPPASGRGPVPVPELALYGGEVWLDGQPAPLGTVIRAYCREDTLCGEAPVEVAPNIGPGLYRITVFGSDGSPDTANYARPGDQIRFTVNDIPATAEPPATWQRLSGEIVKLTAGGAAATLP